MDANLVSTATAAADNALALPIFAVEKVEMQFTVASDFVAAQIANNVLTLALQTGRIIRIDLDQASEVDDIDLPKKPAEVGLVRRLFLDPTASHLIINTTLGECFYLHSQSRQPKQLSKLKGVTIECVSWNPSQPTASTREILIGANDGTVYETYIESTTEFYRREEKYLKSVFKTDSPVSGIWTDTISDRTDSRRVVIATPKRLLHFVGKLGRHGHEGSGSVFAKFFETESPALREVEAGSSVGPSSLVVTPEPPTTPGLDTSPPDRIFAWLSASSVIVGTLLTSAKSDLSQQVLRGTQALPPVRASERASSSRSKSRSDVPSMIALTQWHALELVDNRLVAVNRLDNSVVYNQIVLSHGQRPIALLADLKKNTFWLFTSTEIFEIIATDEDRDVWKVMLKSQKFEEATQYANTRTQKDAIATASGDYLMQQNKYLEAASVYGKSSKPFEEVALAFIDSGQKDALRKYLLTKLSILKKSSVMQRIMLASWLTEIFMAKLNALDDMNMTRAELAENQTHGDVKNELDTIRREYQEFTRRYKADLDHKTIYDIISSHGREEELLFFASTIDDYNYILSYWIQRENWPEALKALNRQTNPSIIYKYSSVLMANTPVEFTDVLMRQSDLDARKLIPAFLNYNSLSQDVPLNQNQSVRYLLFEINQHGSTDPAIHNILLSIYASHPTRDETLLLGYLESQSLASPASDKLGALNRLPYDADFALRLCIQHKRVRSCVHIYTTMGQYASAVELALANHETELAISIAETSDLDIGLRKKLWLAIARSVITSETDVENIKASEQQQQQPKGLTPKQKQPPPQTASISTGLSLLKRAPDGILRIEDLLPLFPDFVLIDAFKDEICEALESYSTSIDELKAEMDDSAATAARIALEVQNLGQNRWVLVEPGEACVVCGLPLLERRFWVWGCGHGAHGNCIENVYVKGKAGKALGRRIVELKAHLEKGEAMEAGGREGARKELQDLIGRECVRCGEVAMRGLDEPFVNEKEDKGDWAL